MTRITRVEVIDENGRSYVNWEDDNDVSWQFQDNGKTLKIFVNKVKSKSPVEEAYKRWMGEYPPTTPSVSNYEDNRWSAFQNGYNASQEQLEREMIKRNLKTSLQELANGDVRPIDDVVRESKKWCEENPEKSVEEYLKPHTPEKTEQLLREAFQKVQQTEEWKETQRKIDAAPEFLKFHLGQSLTDLIYDWWEDVFTKNSNDDMENCIGRLVYWIEEWLPKEQFANSQNVDVEFLVEGFNDAIKKIKSKLR